MKMMMLEWGGNESENSSNELYMQKKRVRVGVDFIVKIFRAFKEL